MSDRFGPRSARVVHDVLLEGDGPVSARDPRVVRLDGTDPRRRRRGLRRLRLPPAPPGDRGAGLRRAGPRRPRPAEDLRQPDLPRPSRRRRPRGRAGPAGTRGGAGAGRRLRPRPRDALLVADRGSAGTTRRSRTRPSCPSDLEELSGLSPAERAELYDNLVFNRYLDPDGTVLWTEFFAEAANLADFWVNADIGAAGPAVWQRLRDRVAGLDSAPLRPRPRDLRRPPARRGRRRRTCWRTCASTATSTATATTSTSVRCSALRPGRAEPRAGVLPAPPRDPRRHPGRSSTRTWWRCCTMDPDDFARHRRRRARRPDRRRARRHLPGRPAGLRRPAGVLPRRRRPARALAGPGRGGRGDDLRAHRLGDRRAAALPPRPGGARRPRPRARTRSTSWSAELTLAGDLTADLTLPEDRVAYFLDVHHALEYAVEGFDDQAMDVFFLLHARRAGAVRRCRRDHRPARGARRDAAADGLRRAAGRARDPGGDRRGDLPGPVRRRGAGPRRPGGAGPGRGRDHRAGHGRARRTPRSARCTGGSSGSPCWRRSSA